MSHPQIKVDAIQSGDLPGRDGYFRHVQLAVTPPKLLHLDPRDPRHRHGAGDHLALVDGLAKAEAVRMEKPHFSVRPCLLVVIGPPDPIERKSRRGVAGRGSHLLNLASGTLFRVTQQ